MRPHTECLVHLLSRAASAQHLGAALPHMHVSVKERFLHADAKQTESTERQPISCSCDAWVSVADTMTVRAQAWARGGPHPSGCAPHTAPGRAYAALPTFILAYMQCIMSSACTMRS